MNGFVKCQQEIIWQSNKLNIIFLLWCRPEDYMIIEEGVEEEPVKNMQEIKEEMEILGMLNLYS